MSLYRDILLREEIFLYTLQKGDYFIEKKVILYEKNLYFGRIDEINYTPFSCKITFSKGLSRKFNSFKADTPVVLVNDIIDELKVELL